MAGVFISYRRADCPAHAGRLADALSARFGADHVFMDVVTIELGVDFVASIQQALGDCDVVLVLIGDNWLSVRDGEGNRRIDDPDDHVRLELSTALARRDVRVIPVLVEGAQMPDASELPADLAALVRRNGLALSDTRWRSDTAVLVDAIDRAMSGTSATSRSAQRLPRQGPAWIVAALVGFAGLWFIAAGRRSHDRRLMLIGVLYTAPVVVAAFIIADPGQPIEDATGWPWLAAWAVSALHFFVLRGRRARESTPGDPG